MLIAKGISFKYPGAEKSVLSDISVGIAPGEMLAIRGPNGCGKTTLAMILAGIFRPDSGSVTLDGIDLFSPEGQKLARSKIGFVFQDPQDGIITTSVEREIAFSPENLGVSADEMRRIVDNLAGDFDLKENLKRPVEELSGGEIERCALAAAVAIEPSVLILDEPDSFLDFEGKRRFIKEIERLKTRDTAIIHITQSGAAAGIADRELLLGDNSSNDNAISAVISDNTSDDTLLQLDNVDFSYGANRVLNGINMRINRGECVAILGPGGAGKTTLARVCAGLFKCDSGEIISKGRVGISFQFPARQLFAETVLGDVAFGPKSLGLDDSKSLAINALEVMGIGEDLFKISPFELSDGEQRRVGIAGVLATGPSCIIFDEPTAALDRGGRLLFIDLVKKLLGEGRGVAIITHDLELAAACSNRAFVLKDGGLVFDSKIDIILENKIFRNSLGLGTERDIYDIDGEQK